jgi:hypothetical protein
MTRRRALFIALMLLIVASVAVAQYRSSRGRGRSRDDVDRNDRNGVPEWPVDPDFPNDLFTFVRIEYDSWGWRGKWATDYPDSDLNFSYRLQELTSLRVNPQARILRLTDDDLFDYPFVYLIEPGEIELSEPEVAALRRYLMNGGFMMVDDFWGEREWYVFHEQIKRVFPDRDFVELELDHEIFHCVYDLKEKPQVPSIHAWWNGQNTERSDAREAHYRAFHDDKGRMVMLICHNTDLGDGWEREGLDPEYFREMSEKYAYPLGINIIVYAMTH